MYRIRKNIVYIVLLVVTFAIVLFNMVISPLYPMVYSQYNQSILYLIGKMIKNGSVPYVDVVDHKGIYVLLFHYIAELIGAHNHIGLFLIGVIIIFISALYIYKMLILINKGSDKFIAFMSSVTFIVLQSLYTISYGTLQSETFIVVGISISLYYFIKDTITKKYDVKSTLLYGVIFSYILFIKANYNIYFLWIAICVLAKCIKEKAYNKIFVHLMYGALGIVIGATPAVLYAICNNCFKEMIYYTFIVNAIYSNAPYFGLNTKMESIIWTISQFKYVYGALMVFILMQIFISKKVDDRHIQNIFKNIFAILLLLIIATIVSARDYSYYLIVILPIVSILLNEYVKNLNHAFDSVTLFCSNETWKKVFKYIVVVSIIICIVNLNLIYGRDMMVDNGKENLRVAKFVKDGYKNATNGIKRNVLVFGAELYLYDYLEVLPSFKYFAVPMIEFKYYREPYIETLEFIASKKSEVLIVGVGATLGEFYKNTNAKDIINNNYRLIAFSDGRSVLKSK